MSLARQHLIGTAFYASAVSLVLLPSAAMATEKVLHKFLGGQDGSNPQAGLIADGAGNFFGTTAAGGGNGTGCENFGDHGCGTVYKITPKGRESVLYAFGGGCDGAIPFGGVLMDNQGKFYGTTGYGGTCNENGYGTVFKLTSGGSETVLYAFQGTTDGALPLGNLISDANGDLFGTTGLGGDMSACGGEGCGTVFEVTPSGNEAVIYAFQGGTDGWNPNAGVISDGSGNLYGTTPFGGSANCQNGCGTVFEVSANGAETILHKFEGGADGKLPLGGLIADSSGNLYSTTEFGGSNSKGTVFKLSPGGTETVLYSFEGGNDGATPYAGVIFDSAGNLYGTIFGGGSSGCRAYGGCGTVWKLTPGGRRPCFTLFIRLTATIRRRPCC